MHRLKKMKEKKNSLLKEMEGITNKAIEEIRSFDETEDLRVKEIKTEIDGIDTVIKVIEERRSFEEIEEDNDKKDEEEDKKEEKRSQSEINNEELKAIFTGQVEERRADSTAMNTNVSEEGGFVINSVISQDIIKAIKDRSDVYSFFNGTSIKGNYKIPKKVTDGTAEWVDENPSTDPTANIANLGMVELGQNRLYRESAITQQMVNVEGVNLEGFVIEDVADSMDDAVEDAMFNGDGQKKPTGIISGIKNANKISLATRGEITLAELKKAKSKIKQSVIKNAKWFMNSETFLLIDLLEDKNGRGLLQPDPSQPTGYILLGLPVSLTDALATPNDSGAKCLIVLATPRAYHTNTQESLKIYVYTDSVYTRRGLIGFGADLYMDGKTKDDEQLVGIFNKATA